MKFFLFHFLGLSAVLVLNAAPAALTEEQLMAAEQPSVLVQSQEKEGGNPRADLVAMLKSQRLAVRSRALDALEDMAGNDFGFDPWADPDKADPGPLLSWEAWLKQPSAAGDAAQNDTRLYAMILTGTEKTRESACRALIARKRQALEFLTGYLEKHPALDADTDRAIRQARFRIQLDDVTPDASLLARKLSGSHRNDIMDALEALRKKPVSTLPVIHEFLEHRDPLVREVAVDVFLQNGKKGAVPHIAPLLERETDENVLQIAFRRATDNEGSRRNGLEKLMVRHASSESEDLCLAALKSLSEMEEAETFIAPEELLKLLCHKEWRIRHQALLYALNGKIIKAPLGGKLGEIRAAAIKSGAVKPSPQEALYPRVLEMFRDEDESVRVAAFRVAAGMESSSLAPALEQLAFDMPDMAPVILYALMAGKAELSPAMQAMIKRMPPEKVAVMVRQESHWKSMLTASEPNDTAKVVLRCLLKHPDPEVKNILAVMEADRLDEDSPEESWRFVLDMLKDPAVPLKTKENMIGQMSLTYGEVGRLCKLAIVGDLKVDPNNSWEKGTIEKIKKLKPFGVELVNLLRQFSTLEDEEYAELKQDSIEALLQHGDEDAFRRMLASYPSLPEETRSSIAGSIIREKEFIFRNLPLLKLVSEDTEEEIRDYMKPFFEKVCEYYSSNKKEDSEGRKLTILNDRGRNQMMQAFLDEIFTGKYGDQYWTWFLREFLKDSRTAGLFERIPHDKYSIFFPRKYIRGVADDPGRSPWQRNSGEFALFLYEYPHQAFYPDGSGEHPVLSQLKTFPRDIGSIPQWMGQWAASPDPMARCNVANMLMPVNKIRMALQAPGGELLESVFHGLERHYNDPSKLVVDQEKAARIPDALKIVSRMAVKDADTRVRIYASLALLASTRQCDVDACCAALEEAARKKDEMYKQDRYDNEWNDLLDYFQDVFCSRLHYLEYEVNGFTSSDSRTLFAFGLPNPPPGKGKLTDEERRLLVNLSSGIMKNRYWPSFFTKKYGAPDSRIAVSFEAMLPGKEKAPSAAGEDTSPQRDQAVARPADPNAPFLVVFFEKSGCDECARVGRELDRLRAEYPAMQVETYSITDGKGTEFNALLSSRFRIPSRDRLIAPSVFGAAGGLMRDRLTAGNLKALLEDSRRQPESGILPDGTRPSWAMMQQEAMQKAGKEVRGTYESLSLGVVLLGGLIDGVNPCAFATLIFFLSYLQIARRSPRELLLTGGSFVLSVYLTYFAIGLAFHELIGQLQAWSSLKMVMDILFSLLALLAAVLSFRDAWLARKGRLADMSLALPAFLKKRIRQTAREQSKSSRFIVAAFVAGIIISALELACTGQVYAPIIYQIRQGSASAVGMLALYNLAFILPLLFIFILAYRGMKAEALIRYQQKHAFLVKMLLGILFLCLAAIIVWGAVR